jgi:tetratricopeptide (TPR) repeat protein
LTFSNRPERALECWDKAIEITQNSDENWASKGIALGVMGRYEEAIPCYDKAIEINQDNYNAWHFKGIALGKMGRDEDAIACSDIAIKIDPALTEAWYNRARLKVRNHDIENGLDDLEQVFRLDKEGYIDLAARDKSFDPIRDSDRFRKLINIV